MTKTFATFGATVQALNTAVQALNTAMNTISGLNTSPPCIILLSKFNRKVRISHHD